MKRAIAVLVSVAFVVLGRPLTGQTPAVFSPLDVRVPVPPRPLLAGGGVTHLAYELHITNLSSRLTTIERIEVRRQSASADAAPLLRLEQATLDAALMRPGAPPDDVERRVLPAGRTVIAFLWVTSDSRTVPTALTHTLAIKIAGPPSSTTASGDLAVDVNGIVTPVSSQQPRAISPPLEGDHWLAANGPDNTANHRRTILALNGEGRIAQRFAIDWVRLYDDGRTFQGDAKNNASYRAFGARALAVADGTVIESVDGIPENIPDPVARAVPITPATLGGNYVLLDLGGEAYATYAHLQPGSLTVKKGDRVRRGQVVGLVGNTGNSTEPHLHFQVADRQNAFDAEGVPYVFDRFALEVAPDQITPALIEIGSSLGIGPAGLAAWKASPARTREMEMPLLNAIVGFVARSR